MTGILVGGVIALLLVEAFHVLITFGLIRRFRELQDILGTAPKTSLVGQPLPTFVRTDINGNEIRSADLGTGVNLVAFFAAGCRPCDDLKKALLSRPPGIPMTMFLEAPEVDATTTHGAEELSALGPTAILELESPLVKQFDLYSFPTLYRVEDGIVTGTGARLSDVVARGRNGR